MAGGNNSKNKGSNAERELCKILSEAFNGSFIRVPNSGAYVGGRNVARREVLSEAQVRAAKGDIIPPDFMKKLVVESKWYKAFPFHALLGNGPVPLLEEWLQQLDDASAPDDVAILAFKVNRLSWFVTVDADKFALANHSVYQRANGKRVVVTTLTDFLRRNKDKVLLLAQ